jgi:hypothetical protein
MSANSSLTVELNRPLDVGEVLGAALRCYQRYPLLFVELTLAVVVPYALIVLVIAGGGPLGGTGRSGLSTLLVQLLDNLVVTPLIS